MIKLPGGWIRPTESYRVAGTNECAFKYEAHSTHTNETLTFWSKGLAEFFVFIINDRVEGERIRLGH